MKRAIALAMFLGGTVGFVLSAFRVIAKSEPLVVLLLSWAALLYEGANALFITSEEKK